MARTRTDVFDVGGSHVFVFAFIRFRDTFRFKGLGMCLSKFVRVWGLVEDFPKKSKKRYPRRRSTAPRTDKMWAKMTGGVVAPPPRHK